MWYSRSMEPNETPVQPIQPKSQEPQTPVAPTPAESPTPPPAPAGPVAPPPDPTAAPPADAPKSHSPFPTGKLLNLVFVVGFASIFIANAVDALENPEGFAKVGKSNAIAKHIGASDAMVWIAIVNDLILGALILTGWKKKYVYAWAGAWLILVAGMKLMNLVF